jgi:hypothetical protein
VLCAVLVGAVGCESFTVRPVLTPADYANYGGGSPKVGRSVIVVTEPKLRDYTDVHSAALGMQEWKLMPGPATIDGLRMAFEKRFERVRVEEDPAKAAQDKEAVVVAAFFNSTNMFVDTRNDGLFMVGLVMGVTFTDAKTGKSEGFAVSHLSKQRGQLSFGSVAERMINAAAKEAVQVIVHQTVEKVEKLCAP